MILGKCLSRGCGQTGARDTGIASDGSWKSAHQVHHSRGWPGVSGVSGCWSEALIHPHVPLSTKLLESHDKTDHFLQSKWSEKGQGRN